MATTKTKKAPVCVRCGHPAVINLYSDVWVCQSCSDEMGREAMDPRPAP